MKKKRALFIQAAVVLITLLLAAFYLAIGFFYRGTFGPGTYINGVYCTGRTVEEVCSILTEKYEGDVISIRDIRGNTVQIPFEDFDARVDFASQLQFIQNRQSPFLWFFHFAAKNSAVEPDVLYNEQLLAQCLADSELTKNNRTTDSAQAALVFIEDTRPYTLFDGRKECLSMQLVESKVKQAIANGCFAVDVSDCYVDLAYTEDMQQVLSAWEKVDAFQSHQIIYDMGDEMLTLSAETLAEFITVVHTDGDGLRFPTDNKGNLLPDEAAVFSFVEELCAEFDTYGPVHHFVTTQGKEIEVEGGTYGWLIDREAERSFLCGALHTQEDIVHIPDYEKEGYHRGRDDIGNTYIEVNMTEQKLYFYIDGEIRIETDVVTGNVARHYDTPSGVNYIYAMQRNRVLHGANYATPVSYWMPVNGNIGLHDASWRKEFGGEIYLRNGSHGCINLPKEACAEIYDMAEVGMPVVMYYE